MSSATPFVVVVAQEMPQWKKDLIQRRKINNGAAAARTPTNSSGSVQQQQQQQQQHEQLGPSSPDLNVESTTTTTTETSQQKQAKTYLYQTPAITSTASAIVAVAASASSSHSTTTSSSTSAITTTTLTKEKSEKFLIGGHYTPSPQASAAAAAAVVDVVSVGQITKATATQSNSNNNNRSSHRCRREENQADEVNDSFSVPTTTTTTATATTAGNVPIPKQRSLLYTTATTTTPTPPANARSQSTSTYNQKITKEQQQEHNLNVNVRANKILREERERECERRDCESNLRSKNNNNNSNSYSCEEESNNAMVNKSPNAMTSNRGEVESGTVTSMVIATTTTTATTAAAASIATTPTGAKPNNNQQSQSYTKCETEQNSAASQVNNFNILCTSAQQQPQQQTHTNAFSSSSSSNISGVVGISGTASGVVSIDKNCKTKISEKLQNNQFIKNQQKQQLQQQQQNFVLPLRQQQQQGFKYKQDTNTVDQQQQQQQQQSPTKITANFSGTKTKMVAVQEMKKNTTQNGGHHHHHHHAHHGQQHHQLVVGGGNGSGVGSGVGVAVGTELDTSEDLKYGPGIVSKLRCRYLSLALRDSMDQQYKQPLRRSTSLNTLLDRDDDEDVIDEADGDDDDDEDDVAAVELRKTTDGGSGGTATQKRDTNAAATAAAGGARAAAGSKSNGNGNGSPTATPTSIFIKKPYPIGGYVKYGPGVATDSNGGTAAALGQHQPVSPTPLLQRHSMATTTTSTSLASNTIGSVEYGNGTGNGTRSRHLKRGNEIMKRARSVEALLSEKSHWLSCNNYKPLATSPLGAGGAIGSPGHQHSVSIEHKISNARERLHSGTDAMPPKRLTSIIDDTERPPPDLVKQTLKKFEASANRRPRVAQRTNGVGDVASKVANYKSIIKEQKPTVMIPTKPTTTTTTTMVSPTKCKLPNFAASTPVPTSPGSTGAGAGAGTVGSQQQRKTNGNNDLETTTAATTATPPPKQRTNAAVASVLERTPDVVPRQHALIAGEGNAATYDSPDTKLSKLLGNLSLVAATESATGNNKPRQATEMFGNELSSSSSTTVTSKSLVGGNAGVAATAKQESNTNVDDVGDVEGNDDDDVNVEEANVGNIVDVDIGKHDEAKSSISIVNNDDDDNDDACVGSVVDDNDDKYIGRYMAKDVDKPLLTLTSTSQSQSQQQQQTVGIAAASAGSGSREFGAAAKQITKSALENIAKAGTTQEFKFTQQNLTTTTTNITKLTNGCETSSSSTTTTTRQIGVIRPLINTAAASTTAVTSATATTTHQHIQQQQQQHTPPALTTREIEKNRINEMKKTHALAADGVAVTSSPLGGAVGFDTIIKQSNSSGGGNGSEPDAVATGSPIWALRKRRQGGNGSGTTGATGPMPADNSMVFNFSKSSKEVPDYIESDVVIFRRKRELPKPNESGFVLLGDLSVETSTDPDCDDFSMCPPSPCDVEFENANIVIDGKSSIRQKPKEFSFRVQFNDTLTTTYDYPSESSLVIDDSSVFVDNYSNIDDLSRNFSHLMLADDQNRQQQQQQQHRQQHHHHVAVDEIIQLPTATSSPTSTVPPTATSANILGNLPLASLGLYTPIKGSTIDNIFQLGVTRPYNSNEAGNGNTAAAAAAAANNGSAGGDVFNGFGEGSSIMGIGEGLIKSVDDSRNRSDAVGDEESDSLHYLKPANDELNIAYSEGTQKN